MQATANRNTELLTTTEAADYLGLMPDTLTVWRCTKAQIIPFLKIGRNVRYRRRDLDSYLETCLVDADMQ